MSYVIPTVSQCVRTLLRKIRTQQPNHTADVHGLVISPTRELTIQISKEFNVAAKVANKYLTKCAVVANTDTKTSMTVESIPVYGGVDIESQISSLFGEVESASHRSLVVVATAGRLLDVLKQDNVSIASAFANLQAIVYDEADRIAVNSEMAGQVDDILSILKRLQESEKNVVSCLVSATLPEKAKEMCEKWVPRSRVLVQVNQVIVGKGTKKAANENGDGNGEENTIDDSSKMPEDQQFKKSSPQNLDLASIPANIVQILHVCSNHKKPKKLIVTLQRIYTKKEPGSGRFTTNNQLTIVFFSQIKTVKYASQLLVKEGLRCVELYGSLPQSEREKRLLEFKSGIVHYRCFTPAHFIIMQ